MLGLEMHVKEILSSLMRKWEIIGELVVFDTYLTKVDL